MRLINKQLLPNYAANTTWMLVERVFRIAIVFLLNILIARYLGPEDFGILNYTISLIGLLIPISLLGFDVVLVREYVVHKKLNGVLFYTSVWLMIVVSTILVLLIWLYTARFEKSSIAILLQIYSLTLLFNPVYVIDYLYQANVLAKYSAIAFTIQSILSALTKLFILYVDGGLYWIVVAFFMDSIWLVICLGGIFLIRRDAEKIKLKYDNRVAKALIKRALPLIFSGLMVSIYMKIDQVMLMWMVDETAVGVYAAAVKLSEAWYFLPTVITASLFPMILHLRKSHDDYYQSIVNLMNMLVYMSLIVAIILYVFNDSIIHFVYGDNYSLSGTVLGIHAWSGIFVSLGLISGKWLIAENLHNYTFYRTFVGAIVNIILNYFLILKYGVIGAALATLIAQIFAAFMFDLFFSKTRKMFFLKLQSLLFLPILRGIFYCAKKYVG